MATTDTRRDSGGSPSRVPVSVPVTAGVVCALVGFTSSFAVVLAGLRAVGADDGQAASGLLAVAVAMGASSMLLSWRYAMPITAAWSTPGAALLATAGAAAGGWPAAIGAFLCSSVLLVVTGLWPRLADLVSRIPAPVAQAMLAGVLLPLCVEPVRAFAADPVAVGPVLAVWLALMRLAPRWAVPGAFAAALAVIVAAMVRDGGAPSLGEFVPHLQVTAPSFTLGALTGIAVPLYLVTMAAQNIPGVAVMKGFGYDVPWRPTLAVTGGSAGLASVFGGHAVNLAAITAALAAGPDAGPDPRRRWIAGVTTGAVYTVMGLASTGLVAVIAAAPAGVVQAVAGVALMGAFASACANAMSDPLGRLPAAVTFLVAASGVSVAGVGSAFWALVTGVVLWWALPRGDAR